MKNIVDYLQKWNVDFIQEGHEHCRPGWLQMDCPYCSKDWRHYRLGYNLSGNYFSCWSCKGVPLIRTLMQLTGDSYPNVKEFLGDIPTLLGGNAYPPKRGHLEFPYGLQPLAQVHKQYLASRGLDSKPIVDTWHIQSIGMNPDGLTGRIFIPIYYQNQIVSWTTRTTLDKARYRAAKANQEKYNHKHLLYGEDFCLKSIIICEGPTDVWRLGPGAVCTFGTAFTRNQLKKMIKYKTRVVCFDMDDEGIAQGRELYKQLKPFPGRTDLVLYDSKDPGSATENEVEYIKKLAKAA